MCALWKGERNLDERRPVEPDDARTDGNRSPVATHSRTRGCGICGTKPHTGQTPYQAAFLLESSRAVSYPFCLAHLRILPDILAALDLDQATVGGIPGPTDVVAA